MHTLFYVKVPVFSLLATLMGRFLPTALFTSFRPIGSFAESATDHVKSSDRYRKAFITTTASLVVKVINVFAIAITVPLSIRTLGNERFGLLATIASATSLLSFADFGIGVGLQNVISSAYGREDRETARRAVSSAVLVISLSAAALLGAGLLAIANVPWERILHLKTQTAIDEFRPATAILLIIITLGMPLGIVQRIQAGYQEGFWFNLSQAGAALFMVIGTICAGTLGGGLSWFLAATYGGGLFGSLIGWYVELRYRRPWLVPTISGINIKACREILKSGLLFLSAQIGASILTAAPALTIARLAGASDVAPFSLLQRVLAIPLTLTLAVVMPLWSAYAEALSVGDLAWIRKTLFRSLLITIGTAIVPILFLMACARVIVKLLSHGQLSISSSVLLPVALWVALQAIRSTLSVAAGGCSLIKKIAIVLPACAAAAVLPWITGFGTANPSIVVPFVAAGFEFTLIIVLVVDLRQLVLIPEKATSHYETYGAICGRFKD